MKSRRIGLEAEVVKYEPGKGLEDGVELWSDVVTKGWIVTDYLVKLRWQYHVSVYLKPQRQGVHL